MIAAFAERVDPGDFITWCTIKDLADCRTEIWRYRRMKAQAVDNAYDAVIEKRVDGFRSALAKAPAEIRTRRGTKRSSGAVCTAMSTRNSSRTWRRESKPK